MGGWLHEEVVTSGRLPFILLFAAFVVTFVVTRVATRMIRSGTGPLKDRVTEGGLHVHHMVPGVVLLSAGAVMAVGSRTTVWGCVSAVLVGVGMSLVLDEFALMLHLDDVYWSQQGRLSVAAVAITGGVIGMALLGITPVNTEEVSTGELTARLAGLVGIATHSAIVGVCLLKGKYRLSLIGVFVPVIALVGAIRLGRPGSWWARKRYDGAKLERAAERAAKVDARWQPRLRRASDLIGGAPDAGPPTDAAEVPPPQLHDTVQDSTWSPT